MYRNNLKTDEKPLSKRCFTMRIPAVLFAYKLIGCLMVSCGMGQAPKELTVNVNQRFSGVLHIHVCDKNAVENNITADGKGEGSTSMCLGKDERYKFELSAKPT